MRISDWSSDVCSSDLAPQILRPGHVTRVAKRTRGGEHRRTRIGREEHTMRNSLGGAMCAAMLAGCLGAGTAAAQVSDAAVRRDRKSVGWGKSVSVRVTVGGRRFI